MSASRRRAVVVGVDASDSARQAVGWSAELASDTGRALRLVHVPATPASDDGMLPAWLRELVDTAKRQGADPALREHRLDGVRALPLGGVDQLAQPGREHAVVGRRRCRDMYK